MNKVDVIKKVVEHPDCTDLIINKIMNILVDYVGSDNISSMIECKPEEYKEFKKTIRTRGEIIFDNLSEFLKNNW